MSNSLPSWVADQYLNAKTATESSSEINPPPPPDNVLITFSPQQMGRRPVPCAVRPTADAFIAPEDENYDEVIDEESDDNAEAPPAQKTDKDALMQLWLRSRGDMWEFIRFPGTDRKTPVRRWGTDEPLKYWEGVSTIVDESSRVCALSLARYNLQGTLTPALGLLQLLQNVDLSHNCLSGEIPEDIFDLENLLVLNLSHNNFSGSVGDGLVRLVKLQQLDLGWNSFRSFIPEGMEKLSSLENMILGHNGFQGFIPPVIASLPVLKVLDLSSNSFEGPIPKEFVAMSERNPQLNYFDASGNKLNAPAGFTNDVWQRDPANPGTRRRRKEPCILGPIEGARQIWEFWTKLFQQNDFNGNGTKRVEKGLSERFTKQPTMFRVQYKQAAPQAPIHVKLAKLELDLNEKGYSPAAVRKRIAAEKEKLEGEYLSEKDRAQKILLPGLLPPQQSSMNRKACGPRGEVHEQCIFLPNEEGCDVVREEQGVDERQDSL